MFFLKKPSLVKFYDCEQIYTKLASGDAGPKEIFNKLNQMKTETKIVKFLSTISILMSSSSLRSKTRKQGETKKL